MKKKFLHIFDIYKELKDEIYKDKSIINLSFDEHRKKIIDKNFSWSLNVKDTFKDFQVIQLISNDIILQKKWCLENKFSKSLNIENILYEQIVKENPDIIFFQNTHFLSKIVNKITRYKFFFYDGTAENNLQIAKQSFGVLTCLKKSMIFYQKNNIKSLYMPHSFNKKILKRVEVKNFLSRKYDLVYSGSVDNRGHFNRVIFLNKIAKNFNIRLYISDSRSFLKIILLIFYFFFTKGFSNTFEYIFSLINLKKKSLNPVYGDEMYNVLANSKISINFHIENSKNEAANMRLFEVLGLGCCLITDFKDNLKDFFSDDEIITYKNTHEAILKIKEMLNNLNLAEDFAKKGNERVLRDHTSEKRWLQMREFLNLSL